MSDIKERYSAYKKKYGLPDFEKLDNIFEISNIEHESFLLRGIRKTIESKIKTFTDIIEDIIHPNSTVSAYHECKFFSDDEKKQLYDLYGKLMGMIRRSNLLEVACDDEQESLFINDVFKSWQQTKKELEGIMKKLVDCWSSDEIKDADTSSYFG